MMRFDHRRRFVAVARRQWVRLSGHRRRVIWTPPRVDEERIGQPGVVDIVDQRREKDSQNV
eukprot:CAMPEP_0198691054 /NCGR_PEP_ID=MMETSP1468-20131203/194466_1 /TAXON_ID=1461545 /ORGANISM="Mantoniella sp, Strain CCMP1436" /LENGTH=60 /DNA_ID=CAMNT_0044443929 /DNA_START=89 /DNA_END=268 /DNA_ORIENTATION=-